MIFFCFVLFVSFVVVDPAGRISTEVDTSIVRLDTSTAVFKIIRAWRRSPPFKVQSTRSDKISYRLNLEHGTLNFTILALSP